MIHVIIGTRAQIIKMAPVMKTLKDRGIPYNFVFLAQHKETMFEIMDQFKIKKPDIVIGDLGRDITNSMDMFLWSLRVLAYGFAKRKKIFRNDKNGIALIHGDAPPLLLGGLLAKFSGLKVAQIEGGLRSFNLLKPFPEELTRVIASKSGLIDIFFCQDKGALENAETYNKEAYCTTYNTMLDGLRIAAREPENSQPLPVQGKYALVTIHRFETISSKKNLEIVVNHIINISKKIKLVFILHPPTREALKNFGFYTLLDNDENCRLLPRLGFFEFNKVLKNCEFIISDGGSNQEESYYLGIPCLLFRNETERKEGLGENAVLSKFDKNIIDEFVDNYQKYRRDPVSDTKSPTDFIIKKLEAFI